MEEAEKSAVAVTKGAAERARPGVVGVAEKAHLEVVAVIEIPRRRVVWGCRRVGFRPSFVFLPHGSLEQQADAVNDLVQNSIA